MNKVLLIIICILLLIIIFPRKSIDTTPYYTKIDSLSKHIDSIALKKDSIDRQIDTITITLEKTYTKYEKTRDIIINNTVSDDYLFFNKYIKDNKQRLDSINNK